MAYRVIATHHYEEVLKHFKTVEKNLKKENIVDEASPICIFVSDDVPEVVVHEITERFKVTYQKVR